jgi:COP9 signalosome complex subunit 7
MEVEGRQVALLEQFVLLAKNVRGRGAAEIVKQATCEPGLFAFGELLDMPSIQEVRSDCQCNTNTLLSS